MENAKPVLVIGATGFLGMEICRQLTAANRSVRGLVRTTSDPQKVQALQEMGVETIEGDIKDKSSLIAAMRDAGSLISAASSTLSHQEGDSIESVDHKGQLNVMEAATEAGIDHVVFISFPESPESFPLQDAKRSAEQALINSGLSYTILRPSFFMEIWLSPAIGFDFPNHKATIYGEGKNRISWISIKDVAAFAVSALDQAEAKNKVIELGGPEALSPLEVVQIFEQLSQPFELSHVPEEAIRGQKNESSDPLQQSIAALVLTLARGGEIDMREKLRIFNIQPTSVVSYSRKVMEGVEA